MRPDVRETNHNMKVDRARVASVLYLVLAALFVGLIVAEFRRATKARGARAAVLIVGGVDRLV